MAYIGEIGEYCLNCGKGYKGCNCQNFNSSVPERKRVPAPKQILTFTEDYALCGCRVKLMEYHHGTDMYLVQDRTTNSTTWCRESDLTLWIPENPNAVKPNAVKPDVEKVTGCTIYRRAILSDTREGMIRNLSQIMTEVRSVPGIDEMLGRKVYKDEEFMKDLQIKITCTAFSAGRSTITKDNQTVTFQKYEGRDQVNLIMSDGVVKEPDFVFAFDKPELIKILTFLTQE